MRKRIFAKVSVIVCVLAILGMLMFNNSRPDTNRLPAESGVALSPLTVTVPSLGRADALLLQEDDHAMLIDTGLESDAAQVLAMLEEQGVEKLELLILSHYDKDHVGGADRILESIPVERVIGPAYPKDSAEYTQFIQAVTSAGLTVETPEQVLTLTFGGSTVTVCPPLRESYAEENDHSVAVVVQHGVNSFLFAGDAEKVRMDELMTQDSINCNWVKMPHHGLAEDNTQVFVHAVAPQYALITCDASGPDEAVLDALEKVDAQVWLTSDGPVRFTSDGSTPITADRD